MNQMICREMLRVVYLKSQHFGWGPQDTTHYVYDFKTMLYTPKPINLQRVSSTFQSA